MDTAASSSKNNTTDVSKLNEDRKRGHEKDHCDDDESLTKKISEEDAANLPPEYDANDSRWTLKYREPAPGLVELMEYSGVYVNADKLAECKALSNDCLTLARRLLTEIFTSSALSTCLVTDATVRDVDNDGTTVSPVLDTHAMIIFLKFIAEYGLEQNFKITDYECIQNSIRQKMAVMKYLKRNVKDGYIAQEPVKKKLRKKRVVLPPEYDAHDARWTLKYRGPAEGLVELMENSGVFVNADKLAKYKKLSNNCESLAQLLLTEVFSTSALSTCSVTAIKVKNSKRNHAIRPTLDRNAVTTLLMFLAEYGLEKKWKVDSNKSMRNIFRQRVRHIRKYGRDDRLKEKRRQERKILLREHNDSKWTLKYREPGEGLVELIEHSGVYVNVDQLADCKRLSNNCKTMAELLLVEVFTERALRTCSIKAVKAKENQDDDNLRPRLDDNALTILLKFLAVYGLEMDWIVRGNKWLRNIFCERMIMMRGPQPNNLVRYDSLETKLVRDRPCLRPENDDDSRWTLKYSEPAEGLVELLEHSGVYVNVDKLAQCKRLAYDCRSLAQMLLTEIYTSKALLSCSLSNKNCRIFAKASEFERNWKRTRLQNQLLPRAELDAHAELVLLSFVDEYALEMGWTVLDFERIRIILLRKLEEIREDFVLERDHQLQKAYEKKSVALCEMLE